MVDIYTCIGCGAAETPLFEALHPEYRRNPGGGNPSDSWDTIPRGLDFEPWFTEMGIATSPRYDLTVNGVAGRLGSSGDVWEKATQQRNDGKSFVKAYGYVPSGDTITWDLTDEGSSRVVIQKVSPVPNHDDFSALDWSPQAGSGGEIEIPLEDPEISIPEPGEGDPSPEPDFTPDPFDISGGEPEIPPIEPDLPPDISQDLDNDHSQDPDPPPPEIDVPSPDQDTSQDQDLPAPDDPDQDHSPEGWVQRTFNGASVIYYEDDKLEVNALTCYKAGEDWANNENGIEGYKSWFDFDKEFGGLRGRPIRFKKFVVWSTDSWVIITVFQ
jgi:hypothetical protein